VSHEIAKLLLEKAGTFLERSEAIETAMSLGMPLSEIESYLDWFENMRSSQTAPDRQSGEKPRENS
jgi:hypothetical protein